MSLMGHLRPSQSTPVPANVRYAPNSDRSGLGFDMSLSADTVAKVFLHGRSKILWATGAIIE
jgi:hypothetical protein